MSWHIALHCFHESYVSTEPRHCQFECQIRTNFGQPTDSALMIKNWSDGLKVKGVRGRNKICGTYRHRLHAHRQRCASVPVYTYTQKPIHTNGYVIVLLCFVKITKTTLSKRTRKQRKQKLDKCSNQFFGPWSYSKSFNIKYLPISKIWYLQ